ncbi:DUF4192 family protein [Microbacterium galbinum]|uniref:DUF4192 domain-containing protein n=1 Tax=Microbacterium galbinum TaxID=2851646 RepID=A0ABY4IQ11_9MICO|nr:DUF4192 family protein [Microbacterium galbinum]UPL14699.1 DUF4192 domain-containing protein [Microbacterium galbinum]
MNTVLRAADSAEFLGIVPLLAGFTPRRSIVMLPFQGSRAYGAMRIDLPRDDVPLEHYADTAIGLVSRVAAIDAVAVVAYVDEAAQSTPDGWVLPHAVALDELLGCAEDAGLRIVDALCVTPGGWASYLEEEPLLHPVEPVRAERVPGIGDVSGDQNSGAVLPVADLAQKERVGRALRDLSGLLGRPVSSLSDDENPEALAALAILDDIPAFYEQLLDSRGVLPPFAVAALLWCLERPVYRDVALLQWASDHASGRRSLGAQLDFAQHGRSIPDELGDIFLGRGPTPDPDRLSFALDVVRTAASRAPRAARPAPLTAAAWLSWALGRSTHAAHYLDVVREIDPDYGLAALVGSMINAAVLPEWTFRRTAGRTT